MKKRAIIIVSVIAAVAVIIAVIAVWANHRDKNMDVLTYINAIAEGNDEKVEKLEYQKTYGDVTVAVGCTRASVYNVYFLEKNDGTSDSNYSYVIKEIDNYTLEKVALAGTSVVTKDVDGTSISYRFISQPDSSTVSINGEEISLAEFTINYYDKDYKVGFWSSEGEVQTETAADVSEMMSAF